MTLTPDEIRKRLEGIQRSNDSTDLLVVALLNDMADEEPSSKPFIWPTEFLVLTQAFGNDPEFYGEFGLPGHEGMDMRAPNGTRIKAVAAGRVTRVDQNHPAYGVSIRHTVQVDGVNYEAIYAHGQKGTAAVTVGQVIPQGFEIMKADSTGNVRGAHLHFSLKRPGRPWTDAKGVRWPFDMIDPTAFFDMSKVEKL